MVAIVSLDSFWLDTSHYMELVRVLFKFYGFNNKKLKSLQDWRSRRAAAVQDDPVLEALSFSSLSLSVLMFVYFYIKILAVRPGPWMWEGGPWSSDCLAVCVLWDFFLPFSWFDRDICLNRSNCAFKSRNIRTSICLTHINKDLSYSGIFIVIMNMHDFR